jgi:hypothetical protein
MVLIAKRRSTMFKNKKKFASAFLLSTFVAASVATTALAAGSTEPPQIPGYDRQGGTVAVPNPDRS